MKSALILKLIYCRWTPYGNTKCIICKQQVHQDAKYCHTCAYSKGDIPMLRCFWPCYLTFFFPFGTACLKYASVWLNSSCVLYGRSLCDVWQASSWHQVLQTEQCVVNASTALLPASSFRCIIGLSFFLIVCWLHCQCNWNL